MNAVLSRLQVELQGNDEGINRAQQSKMMLENALSMAESAETSLHRAAADPEGSDVVASAPDSTHPRPRKSSELLEQQLKLLRVRYSEDHPDVKRVREDLARLKSAEASDAASAENETADGQQKIAVARPRGAAAIEITRQLAQTRLRIANLNAQLKMANHDLEKRASERKRILDSIATYQKHMEQMPVREQEMQALTRDYEISKLQYRSLLEKRAGAEMSTEMERRQKAERFTVLEQARVPEKPFSPVRPLWISVSSLVALVIGVAFGVGREIKQDYLLGEWELPAHVATIGRVPQISHSSGGGRGRWRLTLLSSAVVSVVAIGLYFAWNRF
jgi:uncharacterized protein involved in exopolysaccharide biosynthesis